MLAMKRRAQHQFIIGHEIKYVDHSLLRPNININVEAVGLQSYSGTLALRNGKSRLGA